MQTRTFGKTDLQMSVLTFGCGAVGGLMTKGNLEEQDRAVAWARDNGINHFDTAPLYGNGASEENLGRALGANREGVIISTKVRLVAGDLATLKQSIFSSIETSLRRLRQDHVDLFQLHNTIGPETIGDTLGVDFVLDEVIPIFRLLQDAGKVRFLGFTANGVTAALQTILRANVVDGAQVFYNILNPTAGEVVPTDYPAQNYGQLIDVAADLGVGTIGVRVLAGGALSGSMERHVVGLPHVEPIGSGRDYAADVKRSQRLLPVVAADHANSLPELAIRYAISNAKLSTTEIGIASLEELQLAARAVQNGPLSADALAFIDELRSGFVGEAR
ncbi:MAG: aldo/keto reductase [Hyphomicrobiaceae bacterium]